MKVSVEKAGNYYKELGIRLIKNFRGVTKLLGFYFYIVRIEL